MESPPGLVIVPAFDEAPRIGRVLDAIREAMRDAEILVVDDGSRDDTAACALRHGATLISHSVNLGYGAALQTGYKYAVRHGHGWVVQLDADGQHDPASAPQLLASVRERVADVAIGSRFIRPSVYRMGAVRTAGRIFFRNFLHACGGPWITDPTSGFVALSRRAVILCCSDAFPHDFPDVDVLLLLNRYGMRIVEVPVDMAPSPPGHVSMHAGLRPLYYVFKILLASFRNLTAPRLVSTLPEEDVPHEARSA